MRGFVFSLDSFVALLLALLAVWAMLLVSSTPKDPSVSYSRLHILSEDAMEVMGSVEAGEGESALAAMGRLISGGEENDAGLLAAEVLGPLFPEQFGVSFEYMDERGEWVSVYSRGRREREMEATAVRVVSGELKGGEAASRFCHREDCPSCGAGEPHMEGENFRPIALRVIVWV